LQKLPLFDVIGNTYRFLFREWWTILRLSWFPLLIVTVVNFYVGWVTMTRMGAVFQGAPTDIFSGVSQNVTLSGISALVMMLGTAIVAVALHRVILFGDRKPGQYIYFAFGRVEGLFFLLPLVVTVAGIALMLLGIVPFALTSAFGLQIYVLPVLLFVSVFLLVRFCLIFPIAVVEQRYDFARAWALSRGNFWRIVGVWFVGFVLPAFVLQLAIAPLIFVVFGARMAAGPGPDGIANLLEFQRSLLPIMTAINYVLSIIVGALGVGFLSYSYKALTGHAPDDVLST